jgi:hypothetical protein
LRRWIRAAAEAVCGGAFAVCGCRQVLAAGQSCGAGRLNFAALGWQGLLDVSRMDSERSLATLGLALEASLGGFRVAQIVARGPSGREVLSCCGV